METTTCKSECAGATASVGVFVIGLTIVFTTIITVILTKTKKQAHNIDLAWIQTRNGTSITITAGCKDNMDHQPSRETRISESNSKQDDSKVKSDNEISKGQLAVTVAATNKYVSCGNSNKQIDSEPVYAQI